MATRNGREIPELLPAFSHEDERGRLLEVAEVSSELPVNVKFSQSARGVVRGMHYQTAPFEQVKIIRVCSGAIRDVALCLATGDLYDVTLRAGMRSALRIPRGYAHGFLSLEPDTVVVYTSLNRFDAASDAALSPFIEHFPSFRWTDDEGALIVSAKDRAAPRFRFGVDAGHYLHADGGWKRLT